MISSGRSPMIATVNDAPSAQHTACPPSSSLQRQRCQQATDLPGPARPSPLVHYFPARSPVRYGRKETDSTGAVRRRFTSSGHP